LHFYNFLFYLFIALPVVAPPETYPSYRSGQRRSQGSFERLEIRCIALRFIYLIFRMQFITDSSKKQGQTYLVDFTYLSYIF